MKGGGRENMEKKKMNKQRGSNKEKFKMEKDQRVSAYERENL